MAPRYLTRHRAPRVRSYVLAAPRIPAPRVPVDILHRVLAGLHALGEVAR